MRSSPVIEKIVVVTGGAKGIGRAVCQAFASPGTYVYFNYQTSESDALETEALITAKGGQAVHHKTDVSSESELDHFFKTIVADHGRIDVLVNNAGITRDGLIVRMKTADWEHVIDTNLKGTFLCTKFAAKQMMKKRQGRIVNITSIVGVTGNAGQGNYAAAKAGIIGFTKSMAKELAPRNITVNAVAPGYIETAMTVGMTDQAKTAMIDKIPLKRPGKPKDVAAVVAFLASEEAAYITGQVIHVSGGLYI